MLARMHSLQFTVIFLLIRQNSLKGLKKCNEELWRFWGIQWSIPPLKPGSEVIPNLSVSRWWCECSWWSLSGMCRAQPSSMAVRSFQIIEDVCFKQVSISLQELQSQLFNSRYLLMLSSSVGQPRALGASSLALCVGVTAGALQGGVWGHCSRGRDRSCLWQWCSVSAGAGKAPLCWESRAQCDLCNPAQQSLPLLPLLQGLVPILALCWLGFPEETAAIPIFLTE